MIARFLNHRVSIERRIVTLDDEDAIVLDDGGQPTVAVSAVATGVRAGIQTKRARERAAVSQSDTASADTRIYLLPMDVTTGDVVVHDPSACGLTPDLPAGRYEVQSVPADPSAAHHLELDTLLIGTALVAVA